MNEETIFSAAIAKTNPQERAAFVEQACGGDDLLRSRIEALLEAHNHPDTFFSNPLQDGEQTITLASGTGEQAGQIIGRYKLRERLGEGGFGVVWAAEQIKPVRRKVALKIIKPGMDTESVVARFEAERQALALMDHPNIAHILDGGTTENGRPYFVMELIRGLSITDYCDRSKLSIPQRLELFGDVCRAVQHAHQKGIIHRDIKPSNVLVTLHDGEPVAKIIDFGIAKALSQQLTDKTIYTRVHQAIGTLAYMSPEQAELSGLDIDTRADIYGLGVLLYELLTGATPFDRRRLEAAAFHEACRIIREEDPPKASTKISSLGETATVISLHRHTDPAKLRQLVHGDLDCILMKSLEKDRTRRYQTANDFAADIERCLKDEPVEARSPSAWYRFRKYSRRHRGFMASAAAILATMVLGIAGISGAYLVTLRAVDKQEAVSLELKEKIFELQQAEGKLNQLVGELQEELMDKVFMAVMSGDERKAKEVSERAQHAGVSVSWILIFRGQLALYSGKGEKAIQLLEEARDLAPKSVAANAMLAFAYEYVGYGDKYGNVLIKLKDMEPKDIYDRLYKASSDELYDTQKSTSALTKLVEEHPSWGLARVMLASATVENAWDTGDLLEAKEALRQISIAKVILPDLPMLLAKELMANLCALELAPPDASEREEWISAADRAATRLEDAYPSCAPRELAAYYDHRCDDVDRAIEVLRQAHATGAGPLCESFLAALLFRTGRFEEMEGNTYGWWGLFEIENSETKVLEFCQKLKSEEVILSVPDVWQRTMLYTCGDPEAAIEAWQKLLDDHPGAPWNYKDSMELFTGRITPEGILDRANRSSSHVRIGFAHFCIAIKAIAFEGDRDTAKHHFEKCVEHPVLRIDVHYWARAFLEQMDKNPNWPHWAPKPNVDTPL